MEDETIKHLIDRRKRRRKKIIITFVLVMAILGLLNIFLLMFLGLFLMVIGAGSMMDTSNTVIKWRYYKYVTSGFHEFVEAERKDENKNFGIGVISTAIGFLVFLLSLYLMSAGWYGLLTG